MEPLVLQLARFVTAAEFEDLSPEAVEQLKIRILDALGCAIGAVEGDPVKIVRKHVKDLGGRPVCSLIGGGRTSPEHAAFYNSALVRYLDFNDSYLAKGETCHPSDNLGAILAASEYRGGTGSDLILALAIAYQVQCRLSDEAPVRAKGFDHTTQGSYAAAAGVAKALELDIEQTAHAIAIAGTAYNALRVTRTGELSHWKGLAYPNTAFGVIHGAFLAMEGITGPLEVFEGNKGFMDSIAGPFEIDWDSENLERVTRTIIKRYNAEIHSQSVLEGIFELKDREKFLPYEIERIEIDIFDVAYHIIGGGEEGPKTTIRTKEEADHSLQYLVSVGLLDGEVTPAQFQPERIVADDVQTLLTKVIVRPSSAYSRRFPEELPAMIAVHLRGGEVLRIEKTDYEGFFTRPMSWESVERKFNRLASPFLSERLRREWMQVIRDLEIVDLSDLTELFRRVHLVKLRAA
ncbi:MAG TPA: MmgE/PrpD family protein [Bdellovibrionota bacterium]|nr:MmgE/PrpD family protein [Bdellovibrionota bacterium]